MLDPAPRPPAARLAWASADLPGLGGELKAAPEDFLVEELALYEPCGQGEHLYLWVEKRGLATAAVAAALQRALDVPSEAIGTAGKKDAQAIARQWFSVHCPADPDPARLDGPGFRVLAASRHGNKLRPGHSRGNRFAIVLRGARPDPAAADALLRRVERDGFPNYFGAQRLGPHLATAQSGRRIVTGAGTPRQQGGRTHLERLRFAVNAYQAALFNTLVHERLAALASLETLLPGDLAVLHRNGASFPVAEAELAGLRARAAAHEISPSAPLFGYRVPLAAGEPGAWEQDLLRREGLEPAAFRLGALRVSPKGERRPVRAFAAELAWAWLPETPGALRLSFLLPPGVYATALLREVTHGDDLAPLPPPPAPAG